MSGAVSTGKPVLRGFLKSKTIKHAITVLALSVVTCATVKVFFVDARKKRYEEFYKSYDQDKDYIRMREAGVFRSVSPKGHNDL